MADDDRAGATPHPLFSTLRRRTGRAHRRLESSPPLRRLLADDYSPAEYADLLIRLAGFFGPLETRLLAPGGSAARRCGYRPRTPEILADLMAMDRRPGQITGAEELPCPADPPSEIGCLYVLEGSRLGGRLIARRIGATLGLTPERGLRFFAGDDAAAGRWALFQSRAADLCGGAAETAAAVASAQAVFALLHGWLCAHEG